MIDIKDIIIGKTCISSKGYLKLISFESRLLTSYKPVPTGTLALNIPAKEQHHIITITISFSYIIVTYRHFLYLAYRSIAVIDLGM